MHNKKQGVTHDGKENPAKFNEVKLAHGVVTVSRSYWWEGRWHGH